MIVVKLNSTFKLDTTGILMTDGSKCTCNQVENYLLNFESKESQFKYEQTTPR